MASYRLIHISDLHLAAEAERLSYLALGEAPRRLAKWAFPRAPTALRARAIDVARHVAHPESHSWQATDALARWYGRERAGADFTLVSGDVATTGIRADLEAAATVLTSPTSGIPGLAQDSKRRPTLALDEVRTALMPGNHDRYADATASPGSVEFESVFNQFWPHGAAVRSWIIGTGQDQLGIVAADFSLSRGCAVSAIGRWGRGDALKSSLIALASATTKARREMGSGPNGAVIWAVHFPPSLRQLEATGQISRLDAKLLNLINDDELLRYAQTLNVKLILSGHLHQPVRYSANGVTVVAAGAPVVAQAKDGRWAHTLDVEVVNRVLGSVSRNTFRYSVDESDFELHDSD